jgi:hypothetical protein
MIRGFLRLVGLLLLAGGFVFLLYDGARSIVDRSAKIYKFGQAWSDIHQASLTQLRPLIEQYAPAWAWNMIAVKVLDQPVWLVLGVLGIIFLLLGRKKKPLIGYARD